MPAHHPHRKAAIHEKINKSRKYWRWHMRLNRLFMKLEIERKEKRDVH